MNSSVILQFLKNKKKAFENEHTEGYFYHVTENGSFTHLVRGDEIRYFIEFNKDEKVANEKELGIFLDYYEKFDLASKDWEKFWYETDPAQP